MKPLELAPSRKGCCRKIPITLKTPSPGEQTAQGCDTACSQQLTSRMICFGRRFSNFSDCFAPWRAQSECLIAGCVEHRHNFAYHV